ncbi:hypothetical protein [Leptospira interrogans]|uniref:hypothetical protein n=1 Tax=Leptospira interrogans TaxID=173 RepID=UPI00077344E2|nr:hypothetical protein [Leptospira interrogans]
MKLDVIKNWIPLAGIYFIKKNSSYSIWKKFYFVFVNAIFSLILLGTLTSKNQSISSDVAIENIPQPEIKPLNVEIKTQAKISDKNKIIFTGSTNLPNESRILISLKTMGQDEVFVKDGKFISSEFSYLEKPLPSGKYEVSFEFIPNFEDVHPDVRKVILKDGSNLVGKYIKNHELYGGVKYVNYTTTVNVPKLKTGNDEFVEAVKRIGNGTGKEWISATEPERLAACFVMSKALLKRVDKRHVARLYQELDAFYKDPRMENQEVVTTASILNRMMQK